MLNNTGNGHFWFILVYPSQLFNKNVLDYIHNLAYGVFAVKVQPMVSLHNLGNYNRYTIIITTATCYQIINQTAKQM